MTFEEKRQIVRDYCGGVSCDECLLSWKWTNGSGERCTSISDATEAELNQALEMIGKAAHDSVNHPSHYETGKFECIDVMVETQGIWSVQAFCICNAFKYLYRHKNKNGLEDVKKAIWYLNKFVELEEGGKNAP